MIATIEIPTASGYLSEKMDLKGSDCSILIGYTAEYARLSFNHLNKFYPSQKDLPLKNLERVSPGDLFIRIMQEEDTRAVDIAKDIVRATSGPIVENFEGGQVAVSFRDLNNEAVFRTDSEIKESICDPLFDMEIEEFIAFLFVVASSVNPKEYGLSKSCLSALRELLELMEQRSSMWFFATEAEILARDKVQEYVTSLDPILKETDMVAINASKEGKEFSYFVYDTELRSGEGKAEHVPVWRLFWVKETKFLHGTEEGRTTTVTLFKKHLRTKSESQLLSPG